MRRGRGIPGPQFHSRLGGRDVRRHGIHDAGLRHAPAADSDREDRRHP